MSAKPLYGGQVNRREMPSISEATRSSTGQRRRRIAAGIGLLLTGALFVGLGAAGVVNAGSVRTGALIGGLAVLCCVVLLADRASLGERERSVAAVGAAVGLAGLFVFWALPDGGGALETAVLGSATVYAFGIAVMVGAVLANVTMRTSDSGQLGSDEVTWERTRSASGPSEAAADGGGADDDLAFPLDDDR